MTRLLLFPAILLLSFAPCLGQQGEHNKLSLSECEKLALQNNLSIKNAELGVEVAEARLTRAKHAKILPKVDLKNIWGPSPKAEGFIDSETGYPITADTSTGLSDIRLFTQIDFELVQPIFTFGRLSSLSKAASFGVEAEEANLAREEQSVRFQVRKLYWALVLGKELLSMVQDMEGDLTRAENKIEGKLDEGSDEVSQTDLFKIQIFRYEVNKRLRQAESDVDLGFSALRTVIGLEEDVDFDVAAEYLDPLQVTLDSVAFYYEVASANRPELLQLQAGINAKRASIRSVTSEYYPQIFVAGRVSYNYAMDRIDPRNPYAYNPFNYFRPGIIFGLDMNLNFWQTRDKVRLAKAEYLHLAQKEKLLKDGMKLEVEKAYREIERTQANMKDSRRALRASDSWLRSTSMVWDVGVGDVGDLIDAYKANGAMQGEHLKNIFDYNVAIAKLSRVVGVELYSKEL